MPVDSALHTPSQGSFRLSASDAQFEGGRGRTLYCGCSSHLHGPYGILRASCSGSGDTPPHVTPAVLTGLLGAWGMYRRPRTLYGSSRRWRMPWMWRSVTADTLLGHAAFWDVYGLERSLRSFLSTILVTYTAKRTLQQATYPAVHARPRKPPTSATLGERLARLPLLET